MKANIFYTNKSVPDGCCSSLFSSGLGRNKSILFGYCRTLKVLLLMFFFISNLSYGQSNTNNSQWGKNGPASAPESPVNWENGNAQGTNSHFTEGQSIPTRIELDDLTIGVSTSVTFNINITQGSDGQHAFDFFTGPNRIAETVQPLDGLTGYGGVLYYQFPLPTNLNTGGVPAGYYDSTALKMACQQEAEPLSKKSIWIYNGEVTNITYVWGNEEALSTNHTYCTVTFTPTATKVLLVLGCHIAAEITSTCGGWGVGNGASAISGSPYHFHIDNICMPFDTNDCIVLGSQDQQMASSSIILPPTCSVTPSTATVCAGSTATFTASGINGSGGAPYTFAWTGPGGFTATTAAITVSVAGTYSVIVSDKNGVPTEAPCTATLIVIPPSNAGTDGNTTVCDNSVTAIDLFSLITGEQSGGTWARTTGSGGTFNAGAGTYTPAPEASSSTFTYTVTGVSPCPNDSSVATVNITPQANAGTDGNTTVCDNSVASIDLFSLITGEQSGGTWLRSTGTGGSFSAGAGTYTPAPGATTSTFTYTVTGVAPCPNDSSVATVNITPQANAGTDGDTTVCDNSVAAIDLFSLITGEQSGGTWVRSTGTGGSFSAGAGTYTPAPGATSSTFTYTVTGVSPCPNDSSVATVNITPQANAGTDGNTTVCDSSVALINLFSLITGEQSGGTWARTTGSGGTFNAGAGTYTPAPGATSSTFTYTVTGVSPCPNDSSVATVNITPQANAGTDGNTTVCDNSVASIDLFSLITGEQSGGTWARSTGTGGSFSAGAGTYTPAPGATTSTFTYTLTGVAPCVNDSSVATVNIIPQAFAGNDGNTSVCADSISVINLFSLITGEQSGGTWVRSTGTGGIFNAGAGTFTPAIGTTTSTFTYTVTGVAPCPNDSSVATVNIDPLPVITCAALQEGGTSVDCDVTVTVAQGNTNADYDTWFALFNANNSGVVNQNYTIEVGYVYSPAAANQALDGDPNTTSKAPLNPKLGVSNVIETSVTVTWTVTNIATGCVNSCNATFTVGYNCAIDCSAVPTAVLCKGAATGSLQVTAGGGAPPYTVNLYHFDNVNNVLGTLVESKTNVNNFPVTFLNLSAGYYKYFVKDLTIPVITDGCGVGNPKQITEPSTALNLSPLAHEDETCAGSNTGTITATFSGGTSPYTIKLDDGTPFAAGSPYTFTNVSAGPHTVTVYDASYATSPLAGCIDQERVEVRTIPCDDALCTYTQGYYGNLGGMSCAGGKPYTTKELIEKALMSYPVGTDPETYNMAIGLPGHSVWMTNSAADIDAIIRVLPGGGSSYVLPGVDKQLSDITGINPYLRNGNINNTLLAQTITLGLNLGIDSQLGGFVLQKGTLATAALEGGCGSDIPKIRSCSAEGYTPVLNEYKYFMFPAFVDGMTVQQLFAYANAALGEGTLPAGATMSTLANAVDMVNNAFDGCRISMGYEQKPLADCNTAEKAGFIANPVPILSQATITYQFSYPTPVLIEVLNGSGVLIPSSVQNDIFDGTDADKVVVLNYNFSALPAGNCFIRVTTYIGSYTLQVLKN